MSRNSTRINLGGLTRLASKLDGYSPEALAKVQKRAVGTLVRRLPVEASRLIASEVLNAPRAKIRPLLSARTRTADGEVSVLLQGLQKRLPLHHFIGAKWGGRDTPGAVVQVWRDSPPRIYSAADAIAVGGRGKGGAFALKSRGGVKGGIYRRNGDTWTGGKGRASQRGPRRTVGTTMDGFGMLSGPELTRAVTDQTHGDIYPALIKAGQDVLRAEIARLLGKL